MNKRGQVSESVIYAILGVAIISLVLSGISIAMISGITVPGNPATKDDVAHLRTEITELKSDLKEIRTLVGGEGGGGGEVVFESLEVPWCKAGEPSSIKVGFKNPTDQPGSKEFTLSVGGQTEATLNVQLGGNKSTTKTVNVTRSEGGKNYPVRVSSSPYNTGLPTHPGWSSLVVMSSPPSQYEQAALDGAEEIVTSPDYDASLSPVSLDFAKRELLWFAHAAKPYRGVKLRSIAEPLSYTVAEKGFSVPFWEKLTGMTVSYRLGSSEETTRAIYSEMETQAGAYDMYSSDTDANPVINRRGGFMDLTKYADDNPQLTDQWFDWTDIVRGTEQSIAVPLMDQQRPVGHWNGVPMGYGMQGVVFRKDWITKEAKQEFQNQYGYELVRPDKLKRKEWNWERYLDYAEFFHRPDKGQYGVSDYDKNVSATSWHMVECTGPAGGASKFVEYPDVPLSKERDHIIWDKEYRDVGTLWKQRPYTESLGIGFVGNEPVGALVSHGGNTNGEALQERWNYWREIMNNYAIPEHKEISYAEAYAGQVIDGDVFMTGYLNWVDLFLTAYDGSAIENDLQYAPCPVNLDYQHDNDGKNARWQEGMPIGRTDTSNYTIPKASPHPEAAWLFTQFCQSKTILPYKTLAYIAGNPIRYSTWERVREIEQSNPEVYQKLNKDFLGSLDSSDYHIFCTSMTDPGYFDRRGYMEVISEDVESGIAKGWGGEKTTTEMAKSMEAMLKDLGYLNPNLRDQIQREPWRE